MSEFFKSKRKFGLTLSAVFVVMALAIGSFAFASKDLAQAVNAPGRVESSREEETTEPTEAQFPDDGDDWEDDPAFVSFNAPSEMHGTFLVPGTDFLKSGDLSEKTVKAEIDAAFAAAKELDINSVIIDTVYNDAVIYRTSDAKELPSDFDILAYVLEKARDADFYTYAIFDTSLYQQKSSAAALLSVGAGSVNKLSAAAADFAGTYEPDGILLDGYQSGSDDDGEVGSYADYLSSGGGIGFDNFLRQSPAAVVKTASKSIRGAAPGTQVGLLADAVWENESENASGSATQATYTSLSGGNADTKGFVEKGYVDFVAVKAYTTTDSQTTPFSEVVGWWGGVARENDIPLYVVHQTDQLLSAGDEAAVAQLVQQLAAVEKTGGARGSIYNSLQTVATRNITQAVQENKTEEETGEEAETPAEQVLTELQMTKPEQNTFSTSDPQVTFTGASDPGEPVTINGTEITTDESGYFTVQLELKSGVNEFTVEHKDKMVSYTITRSVQVLKEASPMDNIVTDGGMTITISAVAYQDADVYAVVGGETVPMEVDTSVESEQDRDGFFRNFTGEYTTPASGGSEQDLGRIVVHAEYAGETASIEAASIKVNKKAAMEDGVAVRVVTDQALTYPPNTLNNIPDPKYYPLPAGAMDYAVGDEIVYKKDKKTYTYTVLASGMRVETKDITPITDDYPSNNTISGLSVKSEGRYTYVTLKTAQKVTYSVDYSSTRIAFKFHNTTGVPADAVLSKNPLFTSAKWSGGNTLTLTYVKASTFWGYKGYYDENGNLVLRFKNPPSSLSGSMIAIDPGHGGRDVGARGFLSDYPESVVNYGIAKALAEELESRGATVNLMNNGGIEGEQRKREAEKWGADIFVSIHANSAPRASATGTEVYYFQGFAKTLASYTAQGASGGLSTNNRGAKPSYYHVSLSSQMPSVLIETGFLTNQGEYEKLIKASYQKKIASGIADGISSTIKAKRTGLDASGTESAGNAVEAGAPGATNISTDSGNSSSESGSSSSESGNSSSGSDVAVEAVYIKSTASVLVGKTTALQPTFYPEDITDAPVTFKSSDTSIATVDRDGVVTGEKEGTADITVTTKDGKASAVCTLTVKRSGTREVKVEDIELEEEDVTVEVGKTYLLRGSVVPEDADNSGIKWRSNKSSVVTVSESGRLTGVSEGTATVTATSEDGGYKATCTVTVVDTSGSGNSATDSGAKLSGSEMLHAEEDYFEMNPGMTLRLEILNEYYELVRGGDFTWKSEDRSVATVDSMGNVTAKKVGETTITASAKGFDTLEWTIVVTREKQELRDIGLDERELEIKKGESKTLRVSFYPSNASSRGLRWTSDNTRIATVDENGKVTGVNPGTTTITVKSRDNSKISETCEVEVVSNRGGTSGSGKIEGFYILMDGFDVPDEMYFTVGEEGKLEYEFYPSDASTSDVTWTSKSPNVVKIDSKGNFECLKRGSATIQVGLKNSSVRATCRIVVE